MDAAIGLNGARLASHWQRVGAFVIDVVLIWLVFGLPLMILMERSGAYDYLNDPACFQAAGRARPECQPTGPADFMGYALVTYPLVFLYWWVSNARGASLGKFALGARVIRADGSRPGAGKGFERTCVAVASGYALGLGYLWAFWDARLQTWHDKAAGTYVVRVRP
ncbi:MAG: RDD family protein [Dehalococcoidia bacterium]